MEAMPTPVSSGGRELQRSFSYLHQLLHHWKDIEGRRETEQDGLKVEKNVAQLNHRRSIQSKKRTAKPTKTWS